MKYKLFDVGIANGEDCQKSLGISTSMKILIEFQYPK